MLQTGQEITELDSSGFVTSSPTVFAGNIGEKKYILQVECRSVCLHVCIVCFDACFCLSAGVHFCFCDTVYGCVYVFVYVCVYVFVHVCMCVCVCVLNPSYDLLVVPDGQQYFCWLT